MENREFKKHIEIIDPILLGHGNVETWKSRYYKHYFGINDINDSFIDTICVEYLKGLMWTLLYYNKGCPSWMWKYPFIMAPFISDIYNFLIKTDFDINKIVFEIFFS